MKNAYKKHLLSAGIAALLTLGAFSQDYTPHIDPKPADPNATESVRRLKNYLSSIYGKSTLSGQMDLTWKDSIDMAEKVYKDTGKYPAIMGYDFMNYVGAGGDGRKQVEEAIEWHKKGGIVTFCWHWKGPGRVKEFYAEKNHFSIPYDASKEVLDTSTNEFKWIKRDLDIVANQLQRLQDAGVPVLWRPLHEASGGWFWWGACGSDAYIALYRYMYDYYTKEKGLHNLLWVWNGQDKDWYPGDAYVDIIGTDIYEQNHKSQFAKFNECYEMSDDPADNEKMVALTECGAIPDPDAMKEDVVWWLFFMVWNDTEAKGRDQSNFWEGGFWNDDTFKKKVYTSEYVITLDELPNLQTYPLPK